MYIQDMHINATNGCGFHTGLYKQNFGRVFPYSESKKRRKKNAVPMTEGRRTHVRTYVCNNWDKEYVVRLGKKAFKNLLTHSIKPLLVAQLFRPLGPLVSDTPVNEWSLFVDWLIHFSLWQNLRSSRGSCGWWYNVITVLGTVANDPFRTFLETAQRTNLVEFAIRLLTSTVSQDLSRSIESGNRSLVT